MASFMNTTQPSFTQSAKKQPIFFNDTSQLIDLDQEDDDQGLSFDRPINTGRSVGSTTFRDTAIQGANASKLMVTQNLASIVNHPKQDNMFKKMQKLVKGQVTNQHGTLGAYRKLTEQSVADSERIPKVQFKDFREYLRRIKEPAATYFENHIDELAALEENLQTQEDNDQFSMTMDSQRDDNPFDRPQDGLNADLTTTNKEQDDNQLNSTRNSAALLTRRSSISRALRNVPEKFFSEDYQLEKEFFKVHNQDDVSKTNEQLTKHVEAVEQNLARSIAENFDFFTAAFKNFESMKSDLQCISKQATTMKDCNQRLKENNLKCMLEVYMLERKKANMAKVQERLKFLAVLRQTIPVLEGLIDSASNFEVALELIHNANDLIDTKLKQVKLTEGYKNKIDELKFRCISKLQTECISLVDYYLNSRVQFVPSSNRSVEYKEKFCDSINQYFNKDKVVNQVDLAIIHDSWSFNFDDNNEQTAVFYQRIRNFINSLLKTNEIEQFLRELKQFFVNSTKKFYNQLMDNLAAQIQKQAQLSGADSPIKGKKEVFKYMQSDQSMLTAFLMLALILIQLLTCLQHIERVLKEAVSSLHQQQKEDANFDSFSEKEKMIIVRKQDNFVKLINDDFQDTMLKVKTFFTSKIEKNLKRIGERSQTNAKDFQVNQFFLNDLLESLKTNFQVNMLNSLAILQEQQRKFINDFEIKKTEELKNLLDNEIWLHARVSPIFQNIVTKINSIEDFDKLNQEEDSQKDEESKVQQQSVVSDEKDFLVMGESNYKVVYSLLKFLHMTYDFLLIVRNFPLVSFEGTSRLINFIKSYNSQVLSLILGSGAYEKKKLQTITAKHLSLTCNCVSFILDEIPFIKSQCVVIMKNEGQLRLVEDDFQRLTEDLRNHKQEIIQKIRSILTDTIQGSLKLAKTGIDWNKQADKGEQVTAAQYIQDIGKSVGSMYKVLSQNLEAADTSQVFTEAFRQLIGELDKFYLEDLKDVDSKYAKKQIKLDLQHLQGRVQGLEFGNKEIITMVNQKVNTILTAKCGISSQGGDEKDQNQA